MNIDIKDIITLDDGKKYVVVSKTTYQNSVYYYIIDENNTNNIKFCLEDTKNNSLILVEDTNIINELVPLFLDISKKYIIDLN